MNKRNQELRSLNLIIQENDQKVIDYFLSEKLVVLGESPLYSDSYAVDQYKDLLYEINFTKIADMLHLITHYGAVSNAWIEKVTKSLEYKSSDAGAKQKTSRDLAIRSLHAEKYLRQYRLREIDRSLGEMFPNPIGLHDEYRWYTVASRMLLNEFKRIGLEINDRSDRLYFINDCRERQFVSEFSISSFAEFLEVVMHTSEIFDYQLDWSKKDLTRFVISFVTNEQFRTIENQLED